METTVLTPIPAEQLDALVSGGPVALYPDNLLAQVLVASTYPLELIQLHQWLVKNPEAREGPKEIERCGSETVLGPECPVDGFIAGRRQSGLQRTFNGRLNLAMHFSQQKDVMDAVQRMRAKAQEKGTLVSNDKMKVATQVVESKQVIVIEPSSPEVVYVPSYDPIYAYGTIGYPYPPIYYPPYYYGKIA